MIFLFPLCKIYSFKTYVMQRRGKDSNGIGSMSNSQEGDLAPKGGPTAGLGKADDDRTIPKPYNSDLQTKSAAKSRKTKKKKS